jgi:peroxiredoxin
MFCREQSARLAARYDDIKAYGAELYAIGNGAPPFAEAFREEMGVSFPLLTDPERSSYQAFGMRRSPLDMVSPRLLLASLRARKAGHKQTAVRGDAMQNGGVVVVKKGGDVVYRHVERTSGDLAPMDEVMAALRRAR